ncbi:MAG: ABC transporter ATP-binding protein [Chthonomonadales bacterium]|nr:ABC transporter ATP-binding protein [Chthonomonadales bacterium]
MTHLTVRYGAKAAISDLTLEVPEGCVGLLGPNGAGKTTLLKTLLGFLPPSAGRGSVLGLDVGAHGLAIRKHVGLMPEVDCHIPGMNAVSFVAYAGELSGMPGNHALRRAHEVLEYVGLGEARYRNVETYSTGMKQRIKLAQALVHGPKLLFLDEPTNGLDPEGRDDMLRLVRDISHAKGINVLVSSHLLPDIERTSDTVVVMRSGRIAAQGSVAELRQTAGVQVDIDLQIASDTFVRSLEAAGCRVLSQVGAHCRVQIAEDAADPARLIFEVARDSGAQVRGLRPALRSLEEVFVEVVA